MHASIGASLKRNKRQALWETPLRMTLTRDFNMPFGKYKNKRFSKVPDWYLEWIVRKKIYEKMNLPNLRNGCIRRGLFLGMIDGD